MFEAEGAPNAAESTDSGPQSSGDTDIDSILSEFHGEPTDGATQPGAEPGAAAQAATPAPPQEFEFTWNGKPIKAPIDRITQWASQGYDYAQKMAEFKAKHSEFEQAQKQFEDRISPYRQIDEYAKQNPQWWDHVTQAWETRESMSQDPNNPLAAELQRVQQQLKEVLEFKNQEIQKREEVRIKDEDSKLESEIQSIREQFKDLDWATADAAGMDLEMRVLKHANETGIRNFRAAFRDLMHEDLVSKAEERAKENLVKERQKNTKLGLLGTSPTPKKALGQAQNIKSKSYDQILNEVYDDLGLNAGSA